MADPVGKPANPAAPTAPKPIASIDDLIERAEDRLIPKGSTVRVSPENVDVQTKGRHDELEDSLEACGIKLVWDGTMAKEVIVVEPPAKGGSTPSGGKPSAPATPPTKGSPPPAKPPTGKK